MNFGEISPLLNPSCCSFLDDRPYFFSPHERSRNGSVFPRSLYPLVFVCYARGLTLSCPPFFASLLVFQTHCFLPVCFAPPLSCLVIGLLSFARSSLLSPHNSQRLHLTSDHIQPHTVNAFLIYIWPPVLWFSSGFFIRCQKREFESHKVNIAGHHTYGTHCSKGFIEFFICNCQFIR